jgi:urease accessory protein
VGADLQAMERDKKNARSGPFVFAQVKHGVGVDHIIGTVIHAWQHACAIPHGK